MCVCVSKAYTQVYFRLSVCASVCADRVLKILHCLSGLALSSQPDKQRFKTFFSSVIEDVSVCESDVCDCLPIKVKCSPCYSPKVA